MLWWELRWDRQLTAGQEVSQFLSDVLSFELIELSGLLNPQVPEGFPCR